MAKKKAAAGSSAKKSAKKAAKKAPAKKSAKKAAPKKAAAKKAPAKKSAKKTAPKKAAAKKAPAKKTAPKKAAAKKAAAKRTTKKAVAASVETPSKVVEIPKWLKDKKWLDGQRKALIADRAKQTNSAEVREAEAAALMMDRDPGDVQFDEESGEGDTLAVERDRDLALSAKAREKVDEIDAALARIEKGVYGVCTSSACRPGEEIIPKERLEFLPEAPKCVPCQTSMF